MNIENLVRNILFKNTKIDLSHIENTDLLFNMGLMMDSIIFIQCVVDLENEFDIELYDEELLQTSFATVNNIVEIIENHLKKE